MTRPRVAVVGAGIVGLSAANVLIQSPYQPHVTLIAEKFSPNTTADLSAGVAWPAVAGNTRSTDPRQREWTINTLQYLFSLVASPLAERLNISLISLYEMFDGSREDPWWKDVVLGFRHVGVSEMETLHFPLDKNCWLFSTVVMSSESFLSWQLEQFQADGGNVIQKALNSLQEIDGQYDIIVNCTGLSSRELVNDNQLYPVRGQTVTVKAPWVKHGFGYMDIKNNVFTNVVPRANEVRLGGTIDIDNWSEQPDPLISKGIIERCCKYFPQLATAPVIRETVGLRPGRKTVRLEVDDTITKHSTVIHNYGHCGQGVTFFRGCALDAVKLVEECLVRREFSPHTTQMSKL